ncbi:MAG: hypothetical protein E7267_05765 [Lachnospiraceae bacterium]|nr:hypothetical protein [Lachnospiraceae bacterium]
MIRWYKDLFMDETVAGNPDMHKENAESGKLHIFPLYCVAIAASDDNLLDIISCNELYFKYYKRKELQVLGLASSYKEALKLTEAILMKVYGATGAFDVRKYYIAAQDDGCDN